MRAGNIDRRPSVDNLMLQASAPIPEKTSAVEDFGCYVFSDRVMEARLPHFAYKAMRELMRHGGVLEPNLADSVAFALKEWAMEKGANIFCHWFQPLTDKSALKYDSFIVMKDHIAYAGDARHISEFTGRQLIQGEPDASSFPSGALRSTSQARGYTAWDTTSPCFVVPDDLGGCLYIPTVFSSIFGVSLDNKLPLLKSEKAVCDASLKALELIREAFPDDSIPTPREVYVTMGAEQEVFLIDQKHFETRPDLVQCGRTVIGAPACRGQTMEDHYWGAMPKKVQNCFLAAKERLWRLGIPIATMHNEVAPTQFEIVPSFERASMSCDHNMILMQVLHEEADREGLALLLHEKPFAGVNGSGKHTNWSLVTDTGNNLLHPGSDLQTNWEYLFFLAAFLRATYLHSDLLRACISVPGNDHRLGGMEAPPAIISIFLGAELSSMLRNIVEKKKVEENEKVFVDFGLKQLPKFERHNSDRNRTSPLAYTGNRFEFRAVGSTQNCANPVIVINTIMTETLIFMTSEVVKKISSGVSKKLAVEKVISDILRDSMSVVYDGDCYDANYLVEMQKRGLASFSAPQALERWSSPANCKLFENHNVMSGAEVIARGHVWLELYSRSKIVESRVMINMAETMILPGCLRYQEQFSNSVSSLKQLGMVEQVQVDMLSSLVKKIVSFINKFRSLKEALEKAESLHSLEQAYFCNINIQEGMKEVRGVCDKLEGLVDRKLWPIPTYSDMLKW